MNTMKSKLTVLISALFISLAGFAQDTLILKTGKEVRVKVTEVNISDLKYHDFNNLTGPVYTIEKETVFMIKYENGTKDIFVERLTKNENLQEDYSDYIEVRKYGGPRVGFTCIGDGAIRNSLESDGDRAFFSQFGWQFERRMFTLNNGLSGMVEFVPLIGGLDMGRFIPSFSSLIALRAKKGFEFGIGPNLSQSGAGLVIAAGFSIKSGKVYFPINLAFVPSITKHTTDYDYNTYQMTRKSYETGAKISLLVGFNSRKK